MGFLSLYKEVEDSERQYTWDNRIEIPEAVVTSTVKESLRSTERGSLQVLAVL